MTGRLWAIVLGVAVILVALVAMRPLLPIDETRYLAVALEMRQSGDVLHLTKNGELYTHKTPLLFGLINLVWLITGVSEFAGRLVGPACAVVMVAGTGVLAGRLRPTPGIGVRAALILAGFPVFLFYGSATMFDALLGIGVLAGVAALWRIGQGDAGLRAWGAFGLALGFGVFAKGPVILVHLVPLALTLPIWAAVVPRFSTVAKGLGVAVLVALAATALWLVPTLISATPEYRTELLWTQSAARVAGGMAHDRPFWFLAALVPVMLFPWAWSWPLWRALRGSWRGEPAVRMCVIWAASVLILFSFISGKQVHYLIPVFPAMALLFAFASTTALNRSFAWVPMVLLAALAIAVAAGQVASKGLADITPLWPIYAFGVLCAGLALQMWRLPLIAGHVLAGVGLTLGMHGVIATTGLYAAYDGREMAAMLAQEQGFGLATTQNPYHAEFNFTAGLTAPVAMPKDAAAWAAWAKDNPKGLIFGLIKDNPITVAPDQTLRYMGKEWGIWRRAAIISLGSAP